MQLLRSKRQLQENDGRTPPHFENIKDEFRVTHNLLLPPVAFRQALRLLTRNSCKIPHLLSDSTLFFETKMFSVQYVVKKHPLHTILIHFDGERKEKYENIKFDGERKEKYENIKLTRKNTKLLS